jgi:formyltetrahydrofolate deformylase
VAAVAGFLSESDANILSADQHSTDPEGGTFVSYAAALRPGG